jgi:hypothetical protein
MPGWILSLIISFALRLGLAWLIKRFPNLPPEILDLLEDLISKKQDPRLSTEEKKQAEAETRKKIKEVCTGVGCPSDTKGLG